MKTFLFTLLFFAVETSAYIASGNVAFLSTPVLEPVLKVNSIDFGRRRIDKGPYTQDKDNQPARIVIENTGTMDITIASVIMTGSSGSFVFDYSAFIGKTIKPGIPLEVPITFQPKTEGDCAMRLRFNTDGPDKTVEAEVFGGSIVPKIKIGNAEFGPVRSNTQQPISRTVSITNPPFSEWSYGDVLTITDIVEVNSTDAIGTEQSTYGTRGFVYNKADLHLPLVLLPGESFTFTGYFKPPATGDFEAYLLTVSDALSEVTSRWHGVGTDNETSVDEAMSSELSFLSVTPHPIHSEASLLSFRLTSAQQLQIDIFNTNGTPVLHLADGSFDAGEHSLGINTSTLAAGVYVLHINNGERVRSKNILVIK